MSEENVPDIHILVAFSWGPGSIVPSCCRFIGPLIDHEHVTHSWTKDHRRRCCADDMPPLIDIRLDETKYSPCIVKLTNDPTNVATVDHERGTR